MTLQIGDIVTIRPSYWSLIAGGSSYYKVTEPASGPITWVQEISGRVSIEGYGYLFLPEDVELVKKADEETWIDIDVSGFC